MKIAIGSKPYAGPWGGGNRVVSTLCDALIGSGHKVVHTLSDSDIDFILMIDPRVRSPNVCFGAGAILRYLMFRNSKAIVIHRINECDERKGARFINKKLVRANYAADATVFVAEWLTKLPAWKRNLRAPWSVIPNGSDTQIFNPVGFRGWDRTGPLKLVTHHWGNHWMKGFDVYRRLDVMLAEPRWAARIEFTYIGNLPKGFSFANARYLAPLDGSALAEELRSHHGYVTASINEPGGNHQNEAALCGLPLLYRDSGCFPEYCNGFGISFSGPNDFESALERFMMEYDRLVAVMPQYPWTANRMTREWIVLFERLLNDRPAVVSKRRLWRNVTAVLVNQLSDVMSEAALIAARLRLGA